MMTAIIGSGKKCGKCGMQNVEFLPSLPCGHDFCMICINELTTNEKRTYYLPCLRPDCPEHFAIPAPPDPNCNPRPSLQPPVVRDRYTAGVERKAVIPKPSEGSTMLTELPAFVGDIFSKVMGIALLGNSLYVVSAKRIFLEYNVSDLTTISAPTVHTIEELKWPRGIAASQRYGHLYIVDWSRMVGGCVFRVPTLYGTQPTGGTLTVTKQDFDVQPFGISVSETTVDQLTTILVTCATPMIGNEKVIVFLDDGQTMTHVKTLTLPSVFQTPRHTVRRADGEFVVCHGWTMIRQHRVSKMKLTDETLQEVATYGTSGGNGQQQLRCPLSLCIDEDDQLLVVDYYNHRIQLLTHHLQLVRHLVTERDGIEYPRHACLDCMRGLLFIGLQSGEIHIFKVRP